jgi:selenide,water dikinase
MGGKPILALAVVGMPLDKLPVAVIRDILRGGQMACAAAGIPVAGGHSIDTPEPIYGLAVLGLVHPAKVRRNDRARAGDVLILGKGLGIGVFADAMKKGQLPEAGYRRLLASATQLNTPGVRLADMPAVHALTDVTGFGLLGHLLEICRGSAVGARLEFDALPIFPEALELARQGFAPGAAKRNWASYGAAVALPEGMPEWQRNLLTDPQTSGGLLVACAPEAADAVLAVFHAEGFAFARAVGTLTAGEARVTVAG